MWTVLEPRSSLPPRVSGRGVISSDPYGHRVWGSRRESYRVRPTSPRTGGPDSVSRDPLPLPVSHGRFPSVGDGYLRTTSDTVVTGYREVGVGRVVCPSGWFHRGSKVVFPSGSPHSPNRP